MNIKHILNKHRLEAFVVLFLIVVAVLYFSNGTRAQQVPPLFTRGQTLDPTSCGPGDPGCTVAFFETKNQGSSLTTDTLSFDFTGPGVTVTDPGSDGNISVEILGGGGAFSTTSNVTSNSPGDLVNDDFVFGSTALNDIGVTGRARFFFDKELGAFRAGFVSGSQWNNDLIGENSIALGYDTTASGQFSTAMGKNTTASAANTTAMGVSTTAGRANATAMGNSTTASGGTSTAMGSFTTARSFSETVIGQYNIDYTPINIDNWELLDRLFVIGNGPSGANKSNAMTVLKNGNVGIGTVSPTLGLLQVEGHLATSGSKPGLSGTCNGSGTAIFNGTDTAGVIIMGSGSVVECEIEFFPQYSFPPACTVTGDDVDTTYAAFANVSGLFISVSASSNMADHTVMYICIGVPDN